MHFDPTYDGWKAFRQAITNIPDLKDGEFYPILGTSGYHYQPPTDTKLLSVYTSAGKIHFELHDGREITVPLDWFPILKDANEQEKNTFEVDQLGEEIRFPLLNTEIHITQVLQYKGESQQAEFASSCISDAKLEDALALFTWRMANQFGQPIEDVVKLIVKRLKSWPSPTGKGAQRQKIVIDHSYVGFNLSEEAWTAYGKGKPKDLSSVPFRTDPDLILVVEQLGEKANSQSKFGPKNELEIIEVPEGIPIKIESYDGNEWVAEEHRIWGKDVPRGV